MSTFQDLDPDAKRALREEFDARTTTQERRIEILTLVREGADEAKAAGPCPECGHHPFFAPHDEALIEGHVYSRAGVVEIGITGYCEFCFDKITEEPEVNEIKYPEVHVQLTGRNGSAFVIMGAVSTALRRHGVSEEEIREYMAESMDGDYDNLLATAMKWVSVS